jgi:hypothetical protein
MFNQYNFVKIAVDFELIFCILAEMLEMNLPSLSARYEILTRAVTSFSLTVVVSDIDH